MKKNLLILTLMLFSITTIFPQSGTTGDLTWEIVDGTLTISGTGKMGNHMWSNEVPWLPYPFTAAIIEEGVENICRFAFFERTDLTSVSIGNSVTSIGLAAFYECEELTSIPLGENVLDIGRDAFCRCIALTSITIPKGVIYIGPGTFEFCVSLTSIEIPNTVVYIGDKAFLGCMFPSVTIPGYCTEIGTLAFAFCDNLSSITILSTTPPLLMYDAFFLTSKNDLYVPTSAIATYQETEIWNEFNIIGGGLVVNTLPNLNEGGYTAGDGFYQINETATITATAREGYKFVNWTSIGGVEISTDNPFSFTVTEDTRLFANFEEFTGIEEKAQSFDIKVYPNPTTGELTIENGELGIESIEIFDLHGKKQSSHHLITSSSYQNLNISHFPAGVYFVKITTDSGEMVKKVVKE